MRTLLTLLVAGAIVAGPEPASAQDRRTARALRAAVAEAQRSGTASQRQDFREQTERTTRTFRASQELHLANVSGDIIITRGGGNEIAVEIIKTARGRDDADARELLQLVEVDVVERNNRIEVRTRYPQGDEMRRNNRRNVNVSVSYNVTAPAGARVRATSISGSITARDIRGDVSAESVSGTVRIINGGRVASAKSISGDVEVTDPRSTAASTRRRPAAACCCARSRPARWRSARSAAT